MIVRTRQSELTRRLTDQLNVATATIENLESALASQHAENRRLRGMLVSEMHQRHSLENDLNRATTEVNRLLEDEKHGHINEELQIMNEELEAAHHRIQERLFSLRRPPSNAA